MSPARVVPIRFGRNAAALAAEIAGVVLASAVGLATGILPALPLVGLFNPQCPVFL